MVRLGRGVFAMLALVAGKLFLQREVRDDEEDATMTPWRSEPSRTSISVAGRPISANGKWNAPKPLDIDALPPPVSLQESSVNMLGTSDNVNMPDSFENMQSATSNMRATSISGMQPEALLQQDSANTATDEGDEDEEDEEDEEIEEGEEDEYEPGDERASGSENSLAACPGESSDNAPISVAHGRIAQFAPLICWRLERENLFAWASGFWSELHYSKKPDANSLLRDELLTTWEWESLYLDLRDIPEDTFLRLLGDELRRLRDVGCVVSSASEGMNCRKSAQCVYGTTCRRNAKYSSVCRGLRTKCNCYACNVNIARRKEQWIAKLLAGGLYQNLHQRGIAGDFLAIDNKCAKGAYKVNIVLMETNHKTKIVQGIGPYEESTCQLLNIDAAWPYTQIAEQNKGREESIIAKGLDGKSIVSLRMPKRKTSEFSTGRWFLNMFKIYVDDIVHTSLPLLRCNCTNCCAPDLPIGSNSLRNAVRLELAAIRLAEHQFYADTEYRSNRYVYWGMFGTIVKKAPSKDMSLEKESYNMVRSISAPSGWGEEPELLPQFFTNFGVNYLPSSILLRMWGNYFGDFAARRRIPVNDELVTRVRQLDATFFGQWQTSAVRLGTRQDLRLPTMLHRCVVRWERIWFVARAMHDRMQRKVMKTLWTDDYLEEMVSRGLQDIDESIAQAQDEVNPGRFTFLHGEMPVADRLAMSEFLWQQFDVHQPWRTLSSPGFTVLTFYRQDYPRSGAPLPRMVPQWDEAITIALDMEEKEMQSAIEQYKVAMDRLGTTEAGDSARDFLLPIFGMTGVGQPLGLKLDVNVRCFGTISRKFGIGGFRQIFHLHRQAVTSSDSAGATCEDIRDMLWGLIHRKPVSNLSKLKEYLLIERSRLPLKLVKRVEYLLLFRPQLPSLQELLPIFAPNQVDMVNSVRTLLGGPGNLVSMVRVTQHRDSYEEDIRADVTNEEPENDETWKPSS